MGKAGRNVDHLVGVPAYEILFHWTTFNRSHPHHTLSFHDEEFLCLGVVIVVSSRHSRLGSRYEDLSEVLLLDEFRQATASVGLDIQIVGPRRCWNVREISRIECPVEPIPEVRRNQRSPHLVEGLNSSRKIAELNAVARNLHTSLTASVSRINFCKKRRHYIIYVAQLDFACGIGHVNG